jgi:hypothetical protein
MVAPMPLHPPLRIRQSEGAVWIEDAGGQRCCYTYFDQDAGMRAVRQRWSYEEAVEIVRVAARALSAGAASGGPPFPGQIEDAGP